MKTLEEIKAIFNKIKDTLYLEDETKITYGVETFNDVNKDAYGIGFDTLEEAYRDFKETDLEECEKKFARLYVIFGEDDTAEEYGLAYKTFNSEGSKIYYYQYS